MLFDLTHLISETMPVYPGTASPILKTANTIAADGFKETLLHMTSHTGTHMDAPAHMLEGAATLDALPADRFCGRAVVVDCAHLRGRSVSPDVLSPYAGAIEKADFVLLRTGFEALWGTPDYYGDFAVPDAAAIEWLAHAGLKGVGTDAISIDPMDTVDFPNHMVLFRAGMVNVENLRLAALPAGAVVDFYALPLRFEGADGAPVRAVAVTEERTDSQ